MRFASSVRLAILAIATCVFLVVESAPALAQPGLAPTTPTKAARRGKQASTAIFLSAGTTVVSSLLVVSMSEASLVGAVGVVIGPSVGHWYAGHRNLGGIALRSGGVVLLVAGIAQAMEGQGRDCLGATPAQCAEWEEQWERDDRKAGILLFTGLGVIAASAIYDSATAGRWARTWNDEHGITVTPTLVPGAGGNAPGLVLGGRF